MEENRIDIDLDRSTNKINIKTDVLERNGFVKVVNCKDCVKGINKGNMVICCEDSRMMRIKGLDDFCSCGVKGETNGTTNYEH